MRKVFISYSHKDKEWVNNWLLPGLEKAGIKVHIDVRDFKIGLPALVNMEKAIKECVKTILVLSPHWLKSEWTNFEALMLQTKDPAGLKGSILPLMLEKCELPERLSIFTYANFMEEDNRESELSRLLNQLGVTVEQETTGEEESSGKLPGKIGLSKLPVTGPRVFGREKELEILDKAWADEHTHIVTLVAWGGVGKTALVNHWLNLMEQKNYRGAQKVYGCSFYSQGSKEGTQASADEFFLETLTWFGDPGPEKGSNVDKARRLAQLLQKEKCLLILDGLEPLQYPPGKLKGFDGQLKDPGLKTLLKELSTGHPGLCVITTREKVTDLSHKTGYTVKEILLEQLSDEAGLQLLKNLGIKGLKKEILAAVQEHKGHALALTLLGNYIAVVHEGDIRKRDLIPAMTEEEEKGGHARRVMESYERWLSGSPELDILYMMGLFDRPVPFGAAEALKEAPVIEGVTTNLQSLSHAQWQYTLDRLRNLGLLARQELTESENPVLDCHPLIREHFGQKLRQQNPEGWKVAHKRLYHYFKDLPGKELPDILIEMEPLFSALAHGCQAGLHQKVWDEIFNPKINRANKMYTVGKLGAFGAHLSALSHFFEVPWSKSADGLADNVKARVLNWAAFDLRAVGRLQEAIPPMQAGLEMDVKQGDWKNAAIASSNLSELMLTLGEVIQAVDYAEQGVAFADHCGDDFQKEGKRTTLADALHQSGRLSESEKRFLEAEAMQKKRFPRLALLYGLAGYRFCDLLLGSGKYRKVMERALQTLEWGMIGGNLLTIAFDQLSLGRTLLMQAQALEKKNKNKGGSVDFKQAKDYLDQAVDGLRKAGAQEFLTRGLLARAAYYRIREEFSLAWQDLNEALEIAELGSMKLFMADYHLEAGRLCLAEKKISEAKNHFNIAKKMIDKMGYHRRDKEVLDNELNC